MDAWKLIRFCGFVVELHTHTNVYAVYGRGCSLSDMSSGYGESCKAQVVVDIPEP